MLWISIVFSDADPDPDPTFHLEVDPHPGPDPITKILHMLENHKYIFDLWSQQRLCTLLLTLSSES